MSKRKVIKVLDERKLLAIEKLVEGTLSRTEIAKVVGISRQTLYDWLSDDEFVEEMDNRLQAIKSFSEKKIEANLAFAISNLVTLAADSSNKRVQAQVNQYLVDRALGKPTAKLDLEAGIKETPTDVDVLEGEFEEFDSDNE